MEQTRKRSRTNRVLQGIILLLLIALAAGAFTTEVNAAAKKKTLIVYYSRTNTTQQMAKKIQKVTGADMVRLKTKKAYPSDYDAMLETAQREQNENARPELAGRIANWSQYDTIILGYPIWWGKQPMAINTFLESYDFKGKKIVPFCTSGGSGISASVSSIKRVCPKASFGKGKDVTDATRSSLEKWLKANRIALKSDKSSTKSSKPKATVKIGKKNVTKKTYSLKKGSKATIKVSAANLKGKKKVTFTSSNKKVAAVTKKGIVKAKKSGTAKIKITVTAGKKKVSTWTKIKVVKKSKSPASKSKQPEKSKPQEPGDNAPKNPGNDQQGQPPAVKPDNPSSENTQTDSDILVAYFSCTGTTKSVAEHAAGYLNADIYSITPQVPYSDADLNYRTDCRANREQNDPSARPAISGAVKNMAQYDTVLIGYPIWHGQAPRIISTFLESYDFSGKTIVPFCTSGGSGLGSSASNLHGLVSSSAAWKAGTRFAAGASSSDVQAWLKSEGIQSFTK